MDKRIELYWVEKYPNLFPGYHLTVFDIPMARGFTCGNGWFFLLDDLWKELDRFAGLTIGQVKEKLSGLSVYPNPPHINGVLKCIEVAAIKASRTCEMCGISGQRRSGDWLLTLCDNCHDAKDLWSISELTGNTMVRELDLRTTCESDKDHIPDHSYKKCLCCGAKLVEGEWKI